MSDSTVTIHHNPACGTSCNALALIRDCGIEPVIVEYLKTPPGRAALVDLIALPSPRRASCSREEGEPVIDPGGRRVAR